MSYFSTALNGVLEYTSGTNLALVSGLSQSVISLYANGKRLPSRENIDALLNALPSLQDRWAVARGYLLDNCPKEFLETLYKAFDSIKFPSQVLELAGRYTTDKSLDHAIKHLQYIAQADDKLKEALITFADRL